MICTVDSVGLLSGAVKDVMPAVLPKSPYFVLEHILLDADGDVLELTATNERW